MTGTERVLVAMSGGVDSAAAAALLVAEGHDVTGVHLKLADVPLAEQVPGQGCCSLDDAQDARRAAQVLGIPFYVWDLTEAFRDRVQEPFAATYAAGRTPNPCVECNRTVKYAALLARARDLGFDALATGHHVRREVDPDGTVRLLRARDRSKDQTYVLYVASQDQLRASRFPVGELLKPEVRRVAADAGLRVAGKPESYDICFIPDGATSDYLGGALPALPGPIVGTDGSVLGEHDGVWRYTIGQRRGLGLATHERRYVVDLRPEDRTVVVGTRDDLACGWVELDAVSWTHGVPPGGPVEAQIRAHGATVAAELVHRSGGLRVRFAQPLEGVATGQACVLYAGDECLGGGTIVAAERPAVEPAR